jgi:hypothetical protein
VAAIVELPPLLAGDAEAGHLSSCAALRAIRQNRQRPSCVDLHETGPHTPIPETVIAPNLAMLDTADVLVSRPLARRTRVVRTVERRRRASYIGRFGQRSRSRHDASPIARSSTDSPRPAASM